MRFGKESKFCLVPIGSLVLGKVAIEAFYAYSCRIRRKHKISFYVVESLKTIPIRLYVYAILKMDVEYTMA